MSKKHILLRITMENVQNVGKRYFLDILSRNYVFTFIFLILRRVWSEEETLALLQCYKNRKIEMHLSKKQIFVYENILTNLNALTILRAPTTASTLQIKMNTLIKSYQSAKAQLRKFSFKYMAVMDEIFDGESSNENATQVNSSPDSSSHNNVSSPSNRMWTDSETQAFLRCYESRTEEMLHPTKKKFAYQNILEDLISCKAFKTPATALDLENKMTLLLQAYKYASDAERLTGRGSSTFTYMNLMDDIFGDRPI